MCIKGKKKINKIIKQINEAVFKRNESNLIGLPDLYCISNKLKETNKIELH